MHQTIGDRGFQCKPVGSGGRPEGRGYRDGNGDGGTQEYVDALPPALAIMVPGQEEMEYDPGGEGGEVPDRLHPGDISMYLRECVRPGPHA